MGLSKEPRIEFLLSAALSIFLTLLEPKEIWVRIFLLFLLGICMLLAVRKLDWVKQRNESLSIILGDKTSEQFSYVRFGCAGVVAMSCVFALGMITWPSRESEATKPSQAFLIPVPSSPSIGIRPFTPNGILPSNSVPVIPAGRPAALPRLKPSANLRVRTLELSMILYNFLSARQVDGPQIKRDGSSSSGEDAIRIYNQETVGFYSKEYEPRVKGILDELAEQGITDSKLEFYYKNPFNQAGIRHVADLLQQLAPKVKE
jgi:hypothetical protein